MKSSHKLILVGFMALSAGTFIFGVLQLAGPPEGPGQAPPPQVSQTNAPVSGK